MYESLSLSADDTVAFADLTFASYRPLLAEASATGTIAALGARIDGTPAALALARVLGDGESEILSLFVKPAYRRQGLGIRLVAQLERLLRERGCTQSHTVYTTEPHASPPIERLLQAAGWSVPQPRLVIFRFDRRSLLSPWMRRMQIRPPYEVVGWSEVREADLQKVRTLALASGIPDYLLPFEPDNAPQSAVSVLLRYENELVGWLVGHRVAPDTARYTKLFIEEKFHGSTFAGMGLIAEAIRRQALELGYYSYAICGVRADNERMLRLLRRLDPESVRESRITRRTHLASAVEDPDSILRHTASETIHACP